MQVWVLIGQLSPCSLSPHHERVHGSFDMGFAFTRAVDAHRHRHERPVVTLQHLRHRVSDTHGKLFLFGFLLIVLTHEEVVVGRTSVFSVRTRPGRTRRARGVLRHAWAGSVRVTLLLFFCHLQVRVEEIHAKKLKNSFSQLNNNNKKKNRRKNPSFYIQVICPKAAVSACRGQTLK